MAKQATKKAKGKTQTFLFTAPTAMSVQLVGDFTQWQKTPIPMQQGPGGVWQATVQLEPGEHHYRFLVDGQWRDDPECTLRVPNPYGGMNSVRKVA
jgi:1,4-alpha-glucan branching enzyme